MCTSTEMNKFTIYSRICSGWEKLKHREHVINGQKKEEKEDEEKGMEEKKGGTDHKGTYNHIKGFRLYFGSIGRSVKGFQQMNEWGP